MTGVRPWMTGQLRLKQVPDSLHFLERRAMAYELGKEWSNAERDWSTLVRLTQEENGEYLAKRGECYLHMGRRNDAFRDFSKAVNRTASADTIQRIVSLLGLAESLVPIRSSWLYRTGTAPEADWETLVLRRQPVADWLGTLWRPSVVPSDSYGHELSRRLAPANLRSRPRHRLTISPADAS